VDAGSVRQRANCFSGGPAVPTISVEKVSLLCDSLFWRSGLPESLGHRKRGGQHQRELL
jgi:hypothetical protein